MRAHTLVLATITTDHHHHLHLHDGREKDAIFDGNRKKSTLNCARLMYWFMNKNTFKLFIIMIWAVLCVLVRTGTHASISVRSVTLSTLARSHFYSNVHCAFFWSTSSDTFADTSIFCCWNTEQRTNNEWCLRRFFYSISFQYNIYIFPCICTEIINMQKCVSARMVFFSYRFFCKLLNTHTCINTNTQTRALQSVIALYTCRDDSGKRFYELSESARARTNERTGGQTDRESNFRILVPHSFSDQ